MEKHIRITIGILSLLFLAVFFLSGLVIRIYLKPEFLSEEYPRRPYLHFIPANNPEHYYALGVLTQRYSSYNHSAYIGKYDSKGKLIKSTVIDSPAEESSRQLHIEPSTLYEKDYVYVLLYVMWPDGHRYDIARLNKDDLSLVDRIELPIPQGMSSYSLNNTGILFSNLSMTKNDVQLLRLDFEGNIISSYNNPGAVGFQYTLNDEEGRHDLVTDSYVLNYRVAQKGDKIYVAGTIANPNMPEQQHTGVLLCFDIEGKLLWRQDREKFWVNPREKRDETFNISSYNDLLIDEDKIYVIGNAGVYRYNSDLPEDEKGELVSPIIDEYDLSGNQLQSHRFENQYKRSVLNSIVKTEAGYCVTGHIYDNNAYPLKKTISQTFRLNNIPITINFGFYARQATYLRNGRIAATIDNYSAYCIPKTFSSLKQYQLVTETIESYRLICEFSKLIVMVLAGLSLYGWYPAIRKLLDGRKQRKLST